MKKYWTTLTALKKHHILNDIEHLQAVEDNFQIKLSPTMQSVLKADIGDPIYQQFIPTEKELVVLEDERDDPINDELYAPCKGIVHRYPDRVLLKATQLCEVYCRFCFRKEMIGDKGVSLSKQELLNAFDYIQHDERIWEVILTGGDPLVLSHRRLAFILEMLSTIAHVKIIRIHSRVPVVSPAKISPELIALLEQTINANKTVYMAIHANHINEFTKDSIDALKHLRKAGVLLVSQSVLLKGVNDSVDALSDLMRKFVTLGVKPYYLHQMDFARGTSHFRVEEARAIALMHQLRQGLSGLCIPTLIQEIPHGKKPLY